MRLGSRVLAVDIKELNIEAIQDSGLGDREGAHGEGLGKGRREGSGSGVGRGGWRTAQRPAFCSRKH